jgi:hypothetical protein
MQALVASTEIKAFPLKFDLALAANVQTTNIDTGMSWPAIKGSHILATVGYGALCPLAS